MRVRMPLLRRHEVQAGAWAHEVVRARAWVWVMGARGWHRSYENGGREAT
jgi:hypothetical protein